LKNTIIVLKKYMHIIQTTLIFGHAQLYYVIKHCMIELYSKHRRSYKFVTSPMALENHRGGGVIKIVNFNCVSDKEYKSASFLFETRHM
jgi:hypothetical protein